MNSKKYLRNDSGNNRNYIVIQDTLTTLQNISENKDNEPLYVLGGYIVGATIVRDDIEAIYEQYPLLEIIAELGADLETLENNEDALPVFEEFIYVLGRLKENTSSADS